MQRLVLTVIVAFGFIAFAYAETACRSHSRNSQTSAHSLTWNIRCDNEGYYEELQCTDEANEEKRWCACYNKVEAISWPSKKTRTCVCPQANDQAKNAGTPESEWHQCANTGKFQPRQCRGDMCHCVNAETGEKTTQPERNTNIQC